MRQRTFMAALTATRLSEALRSQPGQHQSSDRGMRCSQGFALLDAIGSVAPAKIQVDRTMQNPKERRLLRGGVVVNVDEGTSRRADVLIAHDRIEAVAAPDTLPPEGC